MVLVELLNVNTFRSSLFFIGSIKKKNSDENALF